MPLEQLKVSKRQDEGYKIPVVTYPIIAIDAVRSIMFQLLGQSLPEHGGAPAGLRPELYDGYYASIARELSAIIEKAPWSEQATVKQLVASGACHVDDLIKYIRPGLPQNPNPLHSYIIDIKSIVYDLPTSYSKSPHTIQLQAFEVPGNVLIEANIIAQVARVPSWRLRIAEAIPPLYRTR